MQTKDKAARALLSAFPTPEAWTAFSQNGDLSLIRDTFLAFGVRSRLIETPDVLSLENFITRQLIHRPVCLMTLNF
jgi:hypothetical protein